MFSYTVSFGCYNCYVAADGFGPKNNLISFWISEVEGYSGAQINRLMTDWAMGGGGFTQ